MQWHSQLISFLDIYGIDKKTFFKIQAFRSKRNKLCHPSLENYCTDENSKKLLKDLKSVKKIKKKNKKFASAYKSVILACLKLINEQENEEKIKL